MISFSMLYAAEDLYIHQSAVTADTTETGLQSGRYQKRDAGGEDAPVFKAKKATSVKKIKKPASVSAQIPVRKPQAEEIAEPEKKEPGLSEQVKDLISGGREHTAEIYREQIHPEDIRNNKIEVDIQSGVYFQNSQANIAYRNFISSSPTLLAGAHLWLTPLLGVSGSYLSTFGATIPSALNSANSVSVKNEWLELSFDVRKFFGMSRRSNSLSYGLIYSQNKLSIPTSETTRIGTTSYGLGLYLGSRFPVAPSYAWVLGGDFFPFVNHGEQATSLNYISGSSNNSTRAGFYLGGEFKMSRESQILWTLGVKLEKNQFSGSANMPDPYSGQTPIGVNVVNTWSYFNLGYRWGQ